MFNIIWLSCNKNKRDYSKKQPALWAYKMQAAFYSGFNSTGQGDNARRVHLVHKGVGNAVLI